MEFGIIDAVLISFYEEDYSLFRHTRCPLQIPQEEYVRILPASRTCYYQYTSNNDKITVLDMIELNYNSNMCAVLVEFPYQKCDLRYSVVRKCLPIS